MAFAAGGAAAVVLGPLRIELGAGAWPERSAIVAAHPSTGGEISLVAGSAAVCFDALGLRPGRAFELGPCGAFEVGRLHAAGFGVTAPGEGNALWTAADLGGRFAWAPVRWLALVLRLDAAIPFGRPTFVLTNVGTVDTPSAVAGRAAAGVEARF